MRNGLARIRSVALFGGDSDIGTAIVSALIAQRGARDIVLAGRRPDRLRQRASDLLERGASRVEPLAFDASDEPERHGAVVQRVRERLGDIDVAIVAFGQLGDQLNLERNPRAAVELIDLNFAGGVSTMIPVANALREQGHGSLVVLSSIAAVRARRANFAYGATKAGLDAFALGLGAALDASGAHILVVRPGFVHSKMTEGQGAAPLATTPEVVARHVVRGLDRGRSTIHVPRSVGVVGAVLRNLPESVVRKLPF